MILNFCLKNERTVSTCLPPSAFTPADVLDLYLHRGGFEIVLSDEDKEQNFDRWCSYTACGQEFWQIIAQWMWNLRLELGASSLSNCHVYHGVCKSRSSLPDLSHIRGPP